MEEWEARRRRRAPGWVRAMDDRALHGLAGRFHREQYLGRGLTTGQDWLLDMAINELEYRVRRALRSGSRACACMFCCGPFDSDDRS